MNKCIDCEYAKISSMNLYNGFFMKSTRHTLWCRALPEIVNREFTYDKAEADFADIGGCSMFAAKDGNR